MLVRSNSGLMPHCFHRDPLQQRVLKEEFPEDADIISYVDGKPLLKGVTKLTRCIGYGLGKDSTLAGSNGEGLSNSSFGFPSLDDDRQRICCQTSSDILCIVLTPFGRLFSLLVLCVAQQIISVPHHILQTQGSSLGDIVFFV